MGWRRQGQEAASESQDKPNGHDSADPDTERRAADILRRLGAGRGGDDEVVDDFMRRVDERAEDLLRDEEKKRHSWW